MNALIEAQELQTLLGQSNVVVIDVGSQENYLHGHIPGAVYLPYSLLVSGVAPVPSAMPPLPQLSQTLAAVGIDNSKTVIAYDDIGGCAAGRLLWTLAAVGLNNFHLLDGGRDAWINAGYELSTTPSNPESAPLSELSLQQQFIADKAEIIKNLDNPNYLVWDARSPDEFTGVKCVSARGGHIPKAINLNWTELLEADKTLKPLATLQQLLNEKGLTADKTIATHCQTHRRSGLTWFVAHCLLGYQNIKGYPGSWSEWGNDFDLPIES